MVGWGHCFVGASIGHQIHLRHLWFPRLRGTVGGTGATLVVDGHKLFRLCCLLPSSVRGT